MSCAGRRSRRGDFRGLDAVKLRKILLEIRVPLIRNLFLMTCGRIGVATIKTCDDVHARSYLTEWSEALAAVVEAGVVTQVDKNLCRPRIRTTCLSKRNGALGIRLRDGVVLYVCALPSLIDGWAASQSELHYKSGDDAKKFHAIEIAVLDQIVKTVCFIRSPRARDLHDEIAFGGRECSFVNVRRFVLKRRGMQQSGIGGGVRGRLGMRWGLRLLRRSSLGGLVLGHEWTRGKTRNQTAENEKAKP